MEQFEALSKWLSSSLEAKIAAALTASTNLPRMVPQNFNDNKKVKTHMLVVLFWLMVHREELPMMVVWDCLMYTGSFKADRKNNLIFLASLSILRVHHLERGCRRIIIPFSLLLSHSLLAVLMAHSTLLSVLIPVLAGMTVRSLIVKFSDFSLIPTILCSSNRLPSPITVRNLSKEDCHYNSSPQGAVLSH